MYSCFMYRKESFVKILKKCLAILFTVFLSFTLFLPDFASGSSDPDTQDSLPISDLIPDISFSDVNIGVLMVPFYSTKESDIFASQLLVMASAQSADDTRELFGNVTELDNVFR